MTAHQRKVEEAEKFVRDILRDSVPETVIKSVALKVARATPSRPKRATQSEKLPA
jgi:hypothetical protein